MVVVDTSELCEICLTCPVTLSLTSNESEAVPVAVPVKNKLENIPVIELISVENIFVAVVVPIMFTLPRALMVPLAFSPLVLMVEDAS